MAAAGGPLRRIWSRLRYPIDDDLQARRHRRDRDPLRRPAKLAVTLRGALIVTDTGFALPVASPLQEVNCWPPLGEAVNSTVLPLL